MKISVVGTGRLGQGLVKVLSKHHDIIWSSRSYEKVMNLIEETGLRATPGTHHEALESDVVIHSLWFKDVMPWVREHREQLRGKILVDVSNPFNEDFSSFTTPWNTSAAEEIQQLIPDTPVVGAFKNTFYAVFHSPVHQGLKSDVYVTSDDAEAKQLTMQIMRPLPFRVLDGGRLSNNRVIERMTLFERELAIRYGHYPYVSFRLFGGESNE